MSHTPLTQTRVAAASVHDPSKVGPTCGASVGMRVPFPSSGKQAPVLSLHHLPASQSASTLQPAPGWHSPFALHEPERQTTAPLPSVHGP